MSPVAPGDRDPVAAGALLNHLGLAARAGGLVSGTDSVRRGIRDGEVHFTLLAEDGSATQHRKLLPLMEARGVPHRTVLTQEEIGRAIGKSPVSALGITNTSFAGRIAELASALTFPQE